MVTKVPAKSTYTPLNIIDQMKRTNISFPMWDVLAIPSQLELLQKELKTVKVQNGPTPMDGVTSFVQPIREEETSKKSNPPPFYLSLIIGDKLVHDFMIDSGARSSMMPSYVADFLGIKYEPMSKGIIQLYGSFVPILEVLRGVKMTLHACLSCIIIQDILVVELPPHFAIFLSRDFTAQIGGYIASHWSFMFFRTRYGTKASIKAKPLALNHIETYNPSPININCTIHEEDEECTTHEHATLLIEGHDYLLDEWANAFQIDPIQEDEEASLGTYCIFEEGSPIPNLMKAQEDTNGLWNMFFDGSRNKNGSGVSVMLVSPSLEKYYFSYRLQFSCTNNVAEYEALI